MGAAMEWHRRLGPGWLEWEYEICSAFERRQMGSKVEEQKPLPVVYRDVQLDCGYRLDLFMEDSVLVEIKAVGQLAPICDPQLLWYLRPSGNELDAH
jgi:GxxExxY protein